LVSTFIGGGNNLESILLISPVADLYLFFRMQECRSPSPQDVGMILLSMGDAILICLRSPDPTEVWRTVWNYSSLACIENCCFCPQLRPAWGNKNRLL
jgi:hypothetical protein